ncbi:hypothetical protein F511_32970 [Dorcoceras hygrometricum]|uniref:DUF7950 domain-containing protein n=1 Tax=Dorcoceras hygrometricum TaxID=472368 RepID=A0A2Z7CLK3_9LAMI|nr:hypothetical protein F511_32970 [Dorcoceras hygrometricum]
MLRFRPIAPKPIAGDQQISGGAVDQSRRNDSAKAARRTKRRYVRVRSRQNKQPVTRKTSDGERSGIEDESQEKGKVTLQLLPAPERSEVDSSFGIVSFQKNQENRSISMYRHESDPSTYRLCNSVVSHKAVDAGAAFSSERSRHVSETWIIVERVTDAYADSAAGVGLGFSDREKIDRLEMDTCPGFVSDCTNKVVWVNEACRKMIHGGDVDATAAHTVRLVVKEKLPRYWPSFACRVRLLQQGPKRSTTVACDVWRMENAGFAWKLDVTTALGLTSIQY